MLLFIAFVLFLRRELTANDGIGGRIRAAGRGVSGVTGSRLRACPRSPVCIRISHGSGSGSVLRPGLKAI